jgi:hypothetical protein
MSSSSSLSPSLPNETVTIPKKRGRKPKIGIVPPTTAESQVNTLVIDDNNATAVIAATTTASEPVETTKTAKARVKKTTSDATIKEKKAKTVKEPKVKEPKVPKKVEEEPEQCPCCIENYTPILRKKAVCKYCKADSCSKCIERYLLQGINDAHCMNCRVNYNDETLREICTMTYIQQVYFKHRQQVLLSREKANLPGLQDAALEERDKREREVKVAEMRIELTNMEDTLSKKKDRYYDVYNDYYSKLSLKSDVTELKKQLQEINTDMDKYTQEIENFKLKIYDTRYPPRIDATGNKLEADKEERKKFIRRCARENCQGYLSSAWKCGLCEYYTCNKCFVPKTKKHDDPHECKQEDVDTAELIKKDSKPCPNCGEFIMKSSGCSQMWCISCKTPWDWNTGKIEHGGMIHNPHYYEWMRRNGNADAIRNPADVPCGGYPNAWELRRIPRTVNKDLSSKFYEFHRICQEIQDISQRTYRSHIDNTTTSTINVRFLLNDYNEEHWGQLLAKNERKRKRDREVQEIFGAFRMVAVELLNRIQNYVKPGAVTPSNRPVTIAEMLPIESEPLLQQFSIEVDGLLTMINDALKQVSIGYHYVVPNIVKNGVYYNLIHKNFYEDVKDAKRQALEAKKKSDTPSKKTTKVENIAPIKVPEVEVPPDQYFPDDSDEEEVQLQAAISASLA